MTLPVGSTPNKSLISTPLGVRTLVAENEVFDVDKSASFQVYSPGIYIEYTRGSFAAATPAIPANFPITRGVPGNVVIDDESEFFFPFTQLYPDGISRQMLRRFQQGFDSFSSVWPTILLSTLPLQTVLVDGVILNNGEGVLALRADIDDPNGHWLAKNPGLLPAAPVGNVLAQAYTGDRVVFLTTQLGLYTVRTYLSAYFGYRITNASGMIGAPALGAGFFSPIAGGSISLALIGSFYAEVYGQAPRVLKAL